MPDSLTPGPIDASLQSLVAEAKADLAVRIGLDSDRITVVEARTVTWPDRGLGCPQPGMIYAQVQVDGVLIRFVAAGKAYEYHGGGTRQPFLCVNPAAAPPGGAAPAGGAGTQ